MPSPFPGMDPFLEDSELWPGFHHMLADQFVGQLNSYIGPKYYADVEVRTIVEDIGITMNSPIYPDTAVFERTTSQPETMERRTSTITLETPVAISKAPVERAFFTRIRTKLRAVHIFVTETGRMVTSIEILSPVNKRLGEGLRKYRLKRRRLLYSPVHMIELDLLRNGERPGAEVNTPPLKTDYVLLVNRNQDGDSRVSEIWPVAMNEPLPVLPVPLLWPDPDVPLELGIAVSEVYKRAGYEWRIDYRKPVPPPRLRPEMAEWLKQHLPQVVD